MQTNQLESHQQIKHFYKPSYFQLILDNPSQEWIMTKICSDVDPIAAVNSFPKSIN